MYDAEEWLAVSGLTVNVSLIEQTLGRSNHSYWLRVGVMFDEDETETTAVEEEAEEDGQHTADASLPSTAVDNEVDISPHILSSSSSKSNNQNDSNNQEDNCEKDTTSITGGSTTGSGTTGGRLYTLAVLSSDVGKLIVPVLEDWVDLCSVRVLIVVGVVVVAVVVVPFILHYAIYTISELYL